MAEYKITKEDGVWKAIVWIGGAGTSITVIGCNFQWLLNILATVFGCK